MIEKHRTRVRMLPGHRKRGSSGTPEDVVTMCKEYSSDLKQKPLNVKLHTHVGSTADGTVGVEINSDGVAELVVKAQGSHIFGLVKKEHLHKFTPGELERTGIHTAFLRRSVKAISKGDEAAIAETLERSLSLIHDTEAVDITFQTKAARDQMGDFIDAKWSVSKLQKSFRRDARITLALRGRNMTLNEQGVYELLEKAKMEQEAEGSMLPVLDPEKLDKLQDDLLNGIHVTYHDKAWKGVNIRSRACRLRYDCQSEEGLIILEPSFTDGGPTIARPVSDLVQVGGGPSAFGLTALANRVTSDNADARAAAVSLVFSDVSMDFTCGKKEDATEIVLFFSAEKGFTRAAPKLTPKSPIPIRSLITAGPTTTSESPTALSSKSVTKSRKDTHAKAMEALFQSEADGPEDRLDVQAALVQATTIDHMGIHHRSAPTITARGGSAKPSPTTVLGVLNDKGRAGRAHKSPVVKSDWSSRFNQGLEGEGDKAALRRQLSAASGFGAQISASSGLGASANDAPRDPTALLPAVGETPVMEAQYTAEPSLHQGPVNPPMNARAKSRVFQTCYQPVSAITTTAPVGSRKEGAAVSRASNFHSNTGVPSRQSPLDAVEAKVSPRRRTLGDGPGRDYNHDQALSHWKEPPHLPSPSARAGPAVKSAAGKTDTGAKRGMFKTRNPPERRSTFSDALEVENGQKFQTAPAPFKGDFVAGDADVSAAGQTRRRGLILRRGTAGDDPLDSSGGGDDGEVGQARFRHLRLTKAIPGHEGGRFGQRRDRHSQEKSGSGQEDRHHLRTLVGGSDGQGGQDHHHPIRHHHDQQQEVAGPVRDHYRENDRHSNAADARSILNTQRLFSPASAEPFTSPAAVAMSHAEAEAAARGEDQLSPLARSGNARQQSGNVRSRLGGPDRGDVAANLQIPRSMSPVDRPRERPHHHRAAVRREHRDSRDARENPADAPAAIYPGYGSPTSSGAGIGSPEVRRRALTSGDGSHAGAGAVSAGAPEVRRRVVTSVDTSAGGIAPPLPARSPTGSSGSGSGSGSGVDMDRSGSTSKNRTSRTLGRIVHTLTSRSGSGTRRRERESHRHERSASPRRAAVHAGGGEPKTTTPSRLRRMGRGVQGIFSSHQGAGTGVDDFGTSGFRSAPGRERAPG